MTDSVRRLAVIRALQLGDMLVAVPALRALRAGYPDAEITLIGLPWAASFAARFDCYVDRFLPFPGYPGIAETPYDKDRTEAFVAEARAHGYDLAVQMHGSGGQSNPFARALGARVTAGYYEPAPGPERPSPPGPLSLTAGEGEKPIISPLPRQGERARPAGARLAPGGLVSHGLGVRAVPGGEGIFAPYPHDRPEVLRNLGLAALLGCPDRGAALEFPLSDADRAEASALLAPIGDRQEPLIGIHPGARPPARRWPPARFAAVADALARRRGARIVLTGGPGEEETAAEVARHMATAPLDVAGRTSLGGLAALLARLDIFIGNDSGPAHLAEAVGTPTVRVFGPADPLRWAPLDRRRHAVVRRAVPCSPCPHWECPIDHRCLRLIGPDDVLRAAERVLTGHAGPVEIGPARPSGARLVATQLQPHQPQPQPHQDHAREGICGA